MIALFLLIVLGNAAADESVTRDFPGPYRLVIVENDAGPTQIHAWTGPGVKLQASRAEGTASRPAESEILIESASPQQLRINARPADSRFPIHLTVFAPSSVHLSIRGQEKSVTIHGGFDGLTVETVSGMIAAYFPADAQIDFMTHTARGRIEWELPAAAVAREAPGFLTGRLGRGGFPVLLRSIEGAIRLVVERREERLTRIQPETTEVAERSATPAYKVDVGLVNLNVKVMNQTGRLIANLTKDDFQVFEQGTLQTVSQFEPTTAPINLVLLLDLSGSMRSKTKLIKKAAIRFVDSLGPSDNIAVAAFTRRFLLVSRFTKDRRLLKERIDDLENRGSGTAFYDAMWATLDLLNGIKETRKAIVVMTDGVDNTLSDPEDYSTKHDFDELLARAAEDDVTIYPLYLDTEYDTVVRRGHDSHQAYAKAFRQVEALSEHTGGVLFRSDRIEDLEGVYGRVAAELRTLYSLAYYPSDQRKDGTWRKVEVRVDKPGAVARTRPGYIAR